MRKGQFLNNSVTESLLILELLQSIESHKSVKAIKLTGCRIKLQLFDFNNEISMEYILTGFNYKKVRESINSLDSMLQDSGKSMEPSHTHKHESEAGMLEKVSG